MYPLLQSVVYSLILVSPVCVSISVCSMESCGLESCGLESCGLKSCSLEYCDLEYCDLESCDLESCGLESCSLESCVVYIWKYWLNCFYITIVITELKLKSQFVSLCSFQLTIPLNCRVTCSLVTGQSVQTGEWKEWPHILLDTLVIAN